MMRRLQVEHMAELVEEQEMGHRRMVVHGQGLVIPGTEHGQGLVIPSTEHRQSLVIARASRGAVAGRQEGEQGQREAGGEGEGQREATQGARLLHGRRLWLCGFVGTSVAEACADFCRL